MVRATMDALNKSTTPAEIAAKRGYRRPATMAFNNASGIGNTEGFRKAWEKRGGKVVANVVYEPNRPSYRSELQKVLAEKPDVIVTGSYLPDTTIILREWFQSGDKSHWIIPGWAANPDLVKAVGAEVCEGIISVDTVSSENGAAFKHFDAIYTKAMGRSALTNVYAPMTYDMMICLALAMEAAGKPRAEVERALLSSADFATSPTDLLALAQYLARFGSSRQAIRLCKQVGGFGDGRSWFFFLKNIRISLKDGYAS